MAGLFKSHMSSLLQNKRRVAFLGSVVFVLMLVYTWHTLNIDSLLPMPLLRGSNSVVVPRYHQVTCPVPAGGHQAERIPVIRGRNVSESRYASAPSSKSHVNGGNQPVDGQATLSVPKVVAMVFYGRRNTVSILDCYLKVRPANILPLSTLCADCSLWIYPLLPSSECPHDWHPQ